MSASSQAPARSRAPLLAAFVAMFLVGTIGAGTGVWYAMKRAGSAHASPPGEPMPLPPGRKDLPPLESASAAPAPLPEPSASALPETRNLPPPPAAKSKPTRPAAPAAKPDDLSNIGRR
jgi:hypothetical protein